MLIRSTREGLRRLEPRDRWAVVGFLRSEPEYNAFLLAHVTSGALGHEPQAGTFAGFWRRGALVGVICVGSSLVVSQPCADDALLAFAHFARRTGYDVRVIVGPDDLIGRFLGYYGRHPHAIAIERGGQRLYRVDYAQLDFDGDCPELRSAVIEELEQVVAADLAMVNEELGFDPFANDMRAYRNDWARRLRQGRTWVAHDAEGRVVFKVDQSATSPDAAQISGIYTAPRHRRRGLARRAIGELCDRLLLDVPVVTLYCHAGNLPAIRLYESLGFEVAGAVRSVWFR